MTEYKETETARRATTLQTMRFCIQLAKHIADNKTAIADVLRANDPTLDAEISDDSIANGYLRMVFAETYVIIKRAAQMPVGYPPERLVTLLEGQLAEFEKDDLSVL